VGHKITILTVLLGMLFAVAACAGNAAPTSTEAATKQAAATATAVSPTLTATPLPTDTPTPLPPLTGSGGRVLAFTSEVDGDFEIYLMAVPEGTDVDGSDQRRLTHRRGEDYWPTWSPDGTQIAFASERDGDFEIYVMAVSGNGHRRKQPRGEEYDGTRLNSCDANCRYDWAEAAFDDGHGDTAPVGSYPHGAS
jgi:hypothetical protein